MRCNQCWRLTVTYWLETPSLAPAFLPPSAWTKDRRQSPRRGPSAAVSASSRRSQDDDGWGSLIYNAMSTCCIMLLFIKSRNAESPIFIVLIKKYKKDSLYKKKTITPLAHESLQETLLATELRIRRQAKTLAIDWVFIELLLSGLPFSRTLYGVCLPTLSLDYSLVFVWVILMRPF